MARKVLEHRAKLGLGEPPTVFELRYGQKEAVATRPAFKGRSTKTVKAWEQFILAVQRLDGVPVGDTVGTPAVVMMSRYGFSSALAILPFGPALWICLEWVTVEGGVPWIGYALRETEAVRQRIQAGRDLQVVSGRPLARKLGWVSGWRGCTAGREKGLRRRSPG